MGGWVGVGGCVCGGLGLGMGLGLGTSLGAGAGEGVCVGGWVWCPVLTKFHQFLANSRTVIKN